MTNTLTKLAIVGSLANYGGGTERALINLLHYLPEDLFDITLLTFSVPASELLPLLPSHVKIKVMKVKRFRDRCLSKFLTFHWKSMYRMLTGKVDPLKLCSYWKENMSFYERDNDSYDVAIAYFLPVSEYSVYTITNIKARKKLLWIHMDLRNEGPKALDFQQIYTQYDKIVAVSQACCKSFLAVFPNLCDMMVVLPNFIVPEEILAKSKETVNDMVCEDGVLNIVSVSRLSNEKQPYFAVEAAELMVKKGINFKWFFVGDGPLRKSLNQYVIEKKLEQYVFFIGARNNPYPYMGNSDIFIQCSKVESYCLTIAEALSLGKFVISTDFPAAHELIDNGRNGMIVQNSPEGIISGVAYVITNKSIIIDNELRGCLDGILKKTKDKLHKLLESE